MTGFESLIALFRNLETSFTLNSAQRMVDNRQAIGPSTRPRRTAFLVRLTAASVDTTANNQLIALLARSLGGAKRVLVITSGARQTQQACPRRGHDHTCRS